MSFHPSIQAAIDALLVRFEAGDYNPTPIIDLGVLVANADGTVDEHEVEALREIFAKSLGAAIEGEVVGHLIEASLEVIRAAGAEARARLIAQILLDCHAVDEGLTVALAVAYSSEGLSASERAVVDGIAREAKLSSAHVDALVERVRAAFDSAK